MMKLWIGALWITMSASACMSSDSGETLATQESEEIGVCGANADEITGIVCSYTYDFLRGAFTHLQSATPFVRRGVDWVKCDWKIECLTSVWATASNGVACYQDTITGTGCNEGPLITSTQTEERIKDRRPRDEIYMDCVAPRPEVYGPLCTALNHWTEQGEDRCCAKRVTDEQTMGN
jgi:hypothetical protein